MAKQIKLRREQKAKLQRESYEQMIEQRRAEAVAAVRDHQAPVNTSTIDFATTDHGTFVFSKSSGYYNNFLCIKFSSCQIFGQLESCHLLLAVLPRSALTPKPG